MTFGRLQYRINTELKEKVEDILETQGIKPSQAITMFYTEIARTGIIPFSPTRVEIPNKELREDIARAQKGKGLKKFNNKTDMFEDLDE
jgi:addiction module RelB/DinJ family antitoxin